MDDLVEVEREFTDATLFQENGETVYDVCGKVTQRSTFRKNTKDQNELIDHEITGWILHPNSPPVAGKSFLLKLKDEPSIGIVITEYEIDRFRFRSRPFVLSDYPKPRLSEPRPHSDPIGLPPQRPALEFSLKGEDYTLPFAEFRLVSVRCELGTKTVRQFNGKDQEIDVEIPNPDADKFTVTFHRRYPYSLPKTLK